MHMVMLELYFFLPLNYNGALLRLGYIISKNNTTDIFLFDTLVKDY